MRRPSEFQVQIEPIAAIVRGSGGSAAYELKRNRTKAGLSVPTISRVYNADVDTLQAKSARRIAEALGYDIDVSRQGVAKLSKSDERPTSYGLSSANKARIRKVVMQALDEVLNEL